MAELHTQISKEEYGRRGREIYDNDVRPYLRPEHDNLFVAVDIVSKAYEIDEDDYTATEKLFARFPDAQIWLIRAGHVATYRIGGRSRIGEPRND